MSTLEVRQLAKVIGKVRWCCSVLTLVDQESKLEIRSLSCLQPLQLAEEWTDTVVPVNGIPVCGPAVVISMTAGAL